MKKRIILTVIFICSVFTAAYAQQMDFNYYNDLSGNDGYAVAIYIPPNKESSIFDRFSKAPGRDLTKLSKSNIWLCWQALNEYDISDGESYMVLICKSLFSPEAIALYVTITNNGTSFKYWGKVIKNDKL